MTTVEERITALEARTAALELRAGLAASRPAAPAPERVAPPAVARRFAPPAAPPRVAAPAARRAAALEDAVGGRLLAWVGGAAVALGLCFLLAIAVSRGWIGEVERTLLAGSASLALLAVGAWAQERRGRTDAARAAAAAGIAGLFATATVAGGVYELVPALVALLAALAVGAVATVLALRWEARGIAGLGILGALLSPALVGALGSGSAVALLLAATAAATAVLIWQRWTWLGFAAFAIATPQWLAYLLADTPSPAVSIAVLAAFGVLTAAAAVGFEVRSSAAEIRIGAIVLLALNALVLALAGIAVLDPAVADGWLVALALAHIGAGIATRRVSAELGLIALTLGVVLADVAAARLLDGLPLLAGWAASGLVFAALTRGAKGLDRGFAVAGLGSHLLFALVSAVALAPPETLGAGPAGAPG